MSTVAGSLLTIVVGIAALGATWSGTYANYVKVTLRWPLVIASLILVTAGMASLFYALRGRSTGHDHAGHGSQGIGALLLVFVVALVMAPPPLGAAAAADRAPNRVPITNALEPIPRVPTSPVTPQAAPPPATSSPDAASAATSDAAFDSSIGEEPGGFDGPAPGSFEDPVGTDTEAATDPDLFGDTDWVAQEISMYAFIGHALFAPEDVVGIPFRFVGFAAEEPDVANSFRLTRYLIGCCAADAFPLQVTIENPEFMPELDDWVVVEAIWHGDMTAVDEWGEGVPVLEVLGMVPIDPPAEPYET